MTSTTGGWATCAIDACTLLATVRLRTPIRSINVNGNEPCTKNSACFFSFVSSSKIKTKTVTPSDPSQLSRRLFLRFFFRAKQRKKKQCPPRAGVEGVEGISAKRIPEASSERLFGAETGGGWGGRGPGANNQAFSARVTICNTLPSPMSHRYHQNLEC